MKYLFLFLLLLTGCAPDPTEDGKISYAPPVVEKPTVNLPLELRQENWIGDQGQGSCVHATLVSLFRWQGRYATANHWAVTFSNSLIS